MISKVKEHLKGEWSVICMDIDHLNQNLSRQFKILLLALLLLLAFSHLRPMNGSGDLIYGDVMPVWDQRV